MAKKTKKKPLVSVIMGSDSDFAIMVEAVKMLDKFGIPSEIMVTSAHRTPEKSASLAKNARKKGIKVIIAGAGGAAHLAGVVAAHTTLPVIGVPITSALDGLDSLLSTVQMPAGIPVGTVAIGKAGAINAAIFAAEIISVSSKPMAKKLQAYKREMVRKVDAKNKKLQKKLWNDVRQLGPDKRGV